VQEEEARTAIDMYHSSLTSAEVEGSVKLD
jgi:hypothetical protein